jgi:hypothetical protein
MMAHEKITVERACHSGFVPTPAMKIGPLCVCKIPDGWGAHEGKEWGIIHIESGVSVSAFFHTRKKAVRVCEFLSSCPDWQKVKRNGKKPGAIKMSDAVRKRLGVLVTVALANA